MENPVSNIERKLVTILSADVAGYSRLMAENEEETLRVFREHKAIFEKLVTYHRGRIFNTAGDAILAEFTSAVEGVRCATEIQSALRTANAKLPAPRQVHFRIGVNVGDVIVQGGDLLGDGVNVAARVQTAAEPGGVCISGSVYDQIASKLSLQIEPMGEKTYKNIPNPVRTFVVSGGIGVRELPTRAKLRVPPWLVFTSVGTFALSTLIAVLILHKAPSHPAPGAPGSDPQPAAKAESAPASNEVPASANTPKPIALAIPASFDRPFSPPEKAAQPKWIVGAEGGNFKTVAEAVDAAGPGDVIEVRPGHYAGHIAIRKPLTIRGLPGPDGKIGAWLENEGTEVVDLIEGDVQIENVAVVLRSKRVMDSMAILQRGGRLTLRNIVAFSGGDMASTGFSLRDGTALISGGEFRGRRGIEQLGGKLRCVDCVANDNIEEGVVVMNQQGSPAFESSWKNVRAERNLLQGFAVMDQAFVHVTGGTFSANGINGVQITGNGKIVLTESEVKDNKENGIVVAHTGQVEFRKGRSNGNRYSGIIGTNDAKMVIEGSELSENGEFGYVAMERATARESGAKISGNRKGAVYRVPASAPASK